ncbi:hypothetical protein RsoM2USA_228 [Ralstonia phage RsoM2USA]|nr:hypothetical protein RsoM2USA_228 [Ralstonia phage RsoM2USA]
MIGRILNKHKDNITQDAVYIGRGSSWGNPFVIGKDGTRAEVVQKYYEWILQNEKLLSRLDELKGKDLVCFCSPQLCHGDVLLDLIYQ